MRALAVLLLLAGCTPPEPEQLDEEWVRPPNHITAQLGMPRCARAALMAGAAWWTEQLDRPMRVYWVTSDSPSLTLPPDGTITATWGPAARPEHRASTFRYVRGGEMVAAEIRLGSCDTRDAAHEIGHALGLGHTSDERRLMYYGADGGWAY